MKTNKKGKIISRSSKDLLKRYQKSKGKKKNTYFKHFLLFKNEWKRRVLQSKVSYREIMVL